MLRGYHPSLNEDLIAILGGVVQTFFQNDHWENDPICRVVQPPTSRITSFLQKTQVVRVDGSEIRLTS